MTTTRGEMLGVSYVPWRLNDGDGRCTGLGDGEREEGEAGANRLLLLE